MILLDPDLKSGPPLKADAARRHAGSGTFRKALTLPSAHALSRFLSRAQAAVGLRGEVSVLLTTDAALRRLNWQFRGKDKATDVLSFPAERSAPGARKIAGDLAISVETARRQAAEQGHGLSTEVKILILHGLLHLNGLDHEKDEGEMARRERALRARLGLEEGLIERAESGASRKRRGGNPSGAFAAKHAANFAQDGGNGTRGAR